MARVAKVVWIVELMDPTRPQVMARVVRAAVGCGFGMPQYFADLAAMAAVVEFLFTDDYHGIPNYRF